MMRKAGGRHSIQLGLSLLIVAVYTAEAITTSVLHRKQHQPQYNGVAPINMNSARWLQHQHQQQHHHHHHGNQRNTMMSAAPIMNRVHRSGGPPAMNQHYLPAIGGAHSRFRTGPANPVVAGPVKRVYLPYKYLPPQLQQKLRYTVNAPMQGKRQAYHALPPAGWKPKRMQYQQPASTMYAHNSYTPPRKNKHPAKYIPNTGKLSHNSAAPAAGVGGSLMTDSHGAPYKLTSTTYGVPHPTQGSPDPPAVISEGAPTGHDAASSFVQVYHGKNHELDAQTSYTFSTQHQLPSQMHKPAPQQFEHPLLQSSQHLALAQPLRIKNTSTKHPSYHHNSPPGGIESPVYRPNAANHSSYTATVLSVNAGHGSHQQDSRHHQSTTSIYGGFQPPKQTYGFLPYDEKEPSSAGMVASHSSSLQSHANDLHYSTNGPNTNTAAKSQTGASASGASSASSAAPISSTSTSSTGHQTREEYLSPNYFQSESSPQ